MTEDFLARLMGAADRCEKAAGQAEQAAKRSADIAVQIHTEWGARERERLQIVRRVERHEARLNQIQGELEDVEETTGQIELRKRDSERARLAELKGQRDSIVRWGAGIVAGLVLAACSTVAGYAARAFVQDASKPAQAQGQR